MPTVCVSMARASTMRLTRLDECGTAVEGVCSTLVTGGFVSVTDTPNYTDPEEITQANANGDLCVDDQSDPALRWLDLAIQMCITDPDAISIITGDPVVTDDAVSASNIGYRIDAGLTASGNFALELWSNIPNQTCPASGFKQYGYWLYPWVRQATWGETVIGNNALILNFAARTQAGSAWGVGPYDIRRDATVPATLEPLFTAIGDDQHKHFQMTTLAPPTAVCGCTELVIP